MREIKTNIYRCVVLMAVILCQVFTVRAEYFRHLNMSNGLSQPSVMAISQDRLGRMWFGTREGINVYDGSAMQSYKGWIKDPVDGKDLWIGNEVKVIVEDADGNLFLLIDYDIIKYDLKAGLFSRFTTSNSVKSLTAHDGAVAYISGDSLFLKEDGDNFSFQFQTSEPPWINSLSMTPDEFLVNTVDGVIAYDRKSHKQRRMLEGMGIYSSYPANDGTIWISATNEGLYRLAPGESEPRLVSVPTAPEGVLGAQQTRRAVEDSYGRIWYGSFSGLFCYDPATGRTDHIEIPANIGGLSHSSIYGLFRDRQNTIWVGSYYGGVNYFSPDQDRFFNFDYSRVAPPGMFHSIIIDFVTDRDGNLWFGTDGAGVCCVDSAWNIVTHLSTMSGDRALRQNNIKALEYDPAGNRVYIGTHLGGLSFYDIDRRHTVNLIDRGRDMLPGDVIHNLRILGDTLYISSRSGLSGMNLRTGDIKKIADVYPTRFDIDPDGNIYFVKGQKAYQLNPLSGKDGGNLLKELASGISNSASILYSDSMLYVGTLGNGLYCIPTDSREPQSFNLNSRNSDLPSDYCYALQPGKNGEIYVATDRNIARVDPIKRSVVSVDFADFFPESNIIAECAFMTRADGSLLVGSTKGITVIHDENFSNPDRDDEDVPDFFLSQLNVSGREVSPNDGSGILKRALPFADEIRLNPTQNSFSMRVATGDYVANTSASTFQYRMDGVDKHWLTAEDGAIHYTNLPPGNYKLHVRRDPAQSNGSDRKIELKVVVEHPWYATWWAIMIYVIAAGAAIWFITVRTRDLTRLKRTLRKEKSEREQIEKLNQEKLVFFTNVSHEFQTPLTLILSHIDLLLAKTAKNERISAPIKRIRIHAEQMSHLITQLLEFRKLQQNHQTIRIGRHDAAQLLRKTAEPFAEYAERRDIAFSIVAPDGPVYGYFDPRLIDRVLVNLISNAFKYTPDGGRIECSIRNDSNGKVVISCADTGKGISEQDLPFIFDRFYNGSADEIKYNDLHYKTTGIGLAFAKSIIDNHHGNISVESKIGEGSVFTVTLPGDKEVFAHDRNVVFGSEPEEVNTLTAAGPQTLPATKELLATASDGDTGSEPDEEKTTLLIVEDNLELRHNLSVFFSTYYNVVTAVDGIDGLEKARDINPDIIISDVLMPNMDGTEMCRRIKSDMALCHIPVILLTALSATESRLDGLNANADDYVTKPYDSAVLLARVDNLLRIRKLLRSQFDKKPVSEIDITVVNPLDRDLLKRTSDFIDAHIADPDLDVPLMCSELGISRSLFYNKFKALTGMTPSAFILSYRLKHAAALLTAQPHLSVTEVADQSGFATTVYFSRCFKKQFGVPPQRYRSSETGTLE